MFPSSSSSDFDVSDGRCGIIVLIPDHCLPFYFRFFQSIKQSSGSLLPVDNKFASVLISKLAFFFFFFFFHMKLLLNSLLQRMHTLGQASCRLQCLFSAYNKLHSSKM